jgi:branched-chain amino acid transport system ATP-binding protein
VSTTVPRLALDGVEIRYGEALAVADVSFTLAPGETLAVLGANGAGKSSLAATIAGAVAPSRGRVVFDGIDIGGWPAHRVARLGIAYVPEGRGIFPHLTVIDNLRALLRYAVAPGERAATLERALETFPVLRERASQQAGTLSGGEQQMLALARVLAAPPSLLVADEMSLGLAPRLVDLVFESLARAKAQGVTILLVEQYVERALALVDRAVVLRQGHVAWQGPASEAKEHALAGYLGA